MKSIKAKIVLVPRKVTERQRKWQGTHIMPTFLKSSLQFFLSNDLGPGKYHVSSPTVERILQVTGCRSVTCTEVPELGTGFLHPPELAWMGPTPFR